MKWISVKERLPDESQIILAFNGEISKCYFNKNPGEGIASLWHSEDAKDLWGLDNVTHWMPLPEPPEDL